MDPTAFRQLFHLLVSAKEKIKLPIAAHSFNYVLIDGFLNECFLGVYWKDNLAALSTLGIPNTQVFPIAPPSKMNHFQCHDFLSNKLEAISKNSSLPLVLIGHSRGARSLLYWALHHPSLVQDRVHSVILLQGALQGSHAADYGHFGTPPPQNLDPWKTMQLKAQRILMGALKDNWLKNLRELTHDWSQKLWDQTLSDCKDAIDLVSGKTYYICSHSKPENNSPVLKSWGAYLLEQAGLNDGRLALKSQKLDGLGTVLLEYEIDHVSFVLPKPFSNAPKQIRTSLMQAIVVTVNKASNNKGEKNA